MRKKRILSALMSAALALSLLPSTALALEQEGGSAYVLMNIPYEDFYRGEIGDKEATGVDAVTSATMNKPRTGSLAGGSYHVNRDGTDITGVTYPVKVSAAELETLNSDGYTRVTDSSSVDITVTNRGQETTTTYSGKDALFESPSYSYYVLDEEELKDYGCYKELEISDGTLTFGKAQGSSTTLSDASATLSVSSNYGDYQLAVTDDSGTINGNTVVSGVLLTTDDGYSYGLRHIENIWQRTSLAFCTGFTTEVHGCPTDSDHYASIMGKTISKITYYTTNGIYEITTNLKVPMKVENSFSVVDAAVSAGTTTVTTTGLDAYDTFICDNTGIVYADGALTWNTSATLPGTYTLTATDAKGDYAPVSTTFTLTTESDAAQYDAQSHKLVNAEGGTDADFQNYLSKITTVSVNGVDYAASGRGAVVIVDSSDGTLDLTVKSGDASVFSPGVNEVEITATGYPKLSFSVEKATFDGGEGTAEDPYQISTVDQLKAIDDTPENLGKNYILTANLDLAGEVWTPLGTFTGSGETPNEATAFHGTFDGNDHTITGLTIDGNMCAGLFGVVANGTVKDLTIENANVTGNCMVAAVVGYAYQSTIDNVDLRGTNTVKGKKATDLPTGDAPNMVAGIVGAGMDSTIQYCDATDTTLTIEGDSSASALGTNAHDIGLVGGGLEGCNLKDCTAAGTITCEENGNYIYGIGGLSGCAVMAESVTNCSANVGISITGGDTYLIGGLLGYTGTTGDAAPSKITGCSAAGSISVSGTRIGQLLGGGYYMDATKAYYPLPARFIVSGSSATTTGAPDLVGYATSLDTVDGSVGANAVFDDGDGSIGNPYEISTAVQLYAVRYGMDKSYKLTADVDVGDTFDVGTTHLWLPIGSYVMKNGEDADRDYAFTGTFDGNGKTISNITVDASNDENDNSMMDYTKFGTFGTGGVFNCVADGTVKDLTVSGVDVKGYALVGGAVGYGDHATLTNVKSIGTSGEHNTIEATAMMGGGVIGGCMESTITDCSAEYVDVTAGQGGNSGALGGGLSHSTVTDCEVDNCTVTAAQGGTWIGGLSGCVNWGDAAAAEHEFKNCTVSNTTIAVNGSGSYVGGLVGASGNTLESTDDARAVIDSCSVKNVDITVGANVTCVGGLIGGGLRDGDVPPNSFAIKNCTVDNASSITTAAADLATSAIGTLVGETYYDQIVTAGTPDTYTDIETEDTDLSGTGTGTEISLASATTIGKVLTSTPAGADFAGGSGTVLDPYQIETAEQFNNIRNHLAAYYKLTEDIDLSSYTNWTPIGAVTVADFDADGNVDSTKAFTGSLDGNGKTISNVTVQDDGTLVGVGLFGTTSGSGVIKNLTLKDVTVTGTASAMAVGGLVGYAMSSGAATNVTLTATKQNTITGTNCVGGLAGGGTSPNNCTVENTTINVFGDNTDPDSEYSFTSGRLVQHDVAECAGLIIGGGFGGTITGNTVTDCTINANQATIAVEAVGLGGIGGCLQCMTSITNNTVNGLTINAPGGHAIGGLTGYAGNGNMAAYGYGTDCTISGCVVTGLAINAEHATHVGGLIGTNMYYMGMEGQFAIGTGCSVSGTITAGTDEASLYGASTPGAVAGHAAGCTIGTVTTSGLTINGTTNDLPKTGMVSVMYESADQDDTKDQTDAGEQLNALIGTYQQLFQGATFDARCDDYWHDAAAAVVGESKANDAVQMMKASVGAETYGSSKVENAFCCKFINGIDRITFNGTEISGTMDGSTVFSHPYQCIGTYLIGESEGVTGFGGFVMQSLDANSGEFTYFLLLPDTMDSTHHIEFRYGDNLADLQKYGQGKYANWLAAGISTSAMNETTGTVGEIDNQLRQVIALFCEENLAYDATGTLAVRSAETLAQLSDFVGIWDANDATLAVMHTYPGFEHAKMYVDFQADGTAKTYVAADGVHYVVSSSYSYFAYDNSSSAKAGVYLVDSAEGVSAAPYEIITSGDQQTLSFFAADGTAAYVKRVGSSSSSGSSGSSGSTTYTVTAPTSVSNGSLSVTPKNAAKGDTVTITATPDSGYEMSALTVTDASGNKLSVTDKGNGKYTFTMPASKVSVSAVFQKSGTAAATSFTDVADNAYYKDAVAWAVEQGITNGTSATTFAPNATCTRAQVVTFLWRASGSPEPTSTNHPFTDVSASDYAYKAVLWAVEKGITQGTTATTFAPNATVTRGQTVTFLWRAAGKPTVASSNPFVDVSDGDYYADAVAWAVSEGITQGTTSTTFAPGNACTRSQVVTFLYRELTK